MSFIVTCFDTKAETMKYLRAAVETGKANADDFEMRLVETTERRFASTFQRESEALAAAKLFSSASGRAYGHVSSRYDFESDPLKAQCSGRPSGGRYALRSGDGMGEYREIVIGQFGSDFVYEAPLILENAKACAAGIKAVLDGRAEDYDHTFTVERRPPIQFLGTAAQRMRVEAHDGRIALNLIQDSPEGRRLEWGYSLECPERFLGKLDQLVAECEQQLDEDQTRDADDNAPAAP